MKKKYKDTYIILCKYIMECISVTETEISPAERMYKNHLKNVANYQKRHKDKIKEKHSRYMKKLREEPERYNKYLERSKEYYHKVLKHRKKQLKNDASI